MTWLVIGGLAWLLLALAMAVAMGRGIRVADERASADALTGQVDRFLRERAKRHLSLTTPRPPSAAS